MVVILILVIAAFGSGFFLGRTVRDSKRQSKPALPIRVVVRTVADDDPLADFLSRERRYLRLFGDDE